MTTALLGTDRRPVPDGMPTLWDGPDRDDPAEVVLAQAARHRAAVRAGARLGQLRRSRHAPPAATAEPAPAAAQKLIGRPSRGPRLPPRSTGG